MEPGRRVLPWFVALLAWLAVMGSFFALYDPFHPVGEDLLGGLGTFDEGLPLAPGGFKGPPVGDGRDHAWLHYGDVAWEPEGGLAGSGAARLRVGPDGHRAALRLRVGGVQRYRYLGISCWVRAAGVRKGRQEWAWPRVLLVPRDDRGRGMWDHTRPTLIVEGDRGWTRVSGVYRIYPDDARVDVYLQHAGAAGTFWVDEVRLHPMRLEIGLAAWKAFFAAGWFLLVGGAFHSLGLFEGRWRWPFVAVVGAILLGVMLPGQVLNYETKRAVDSIVAVAREVRSAWRVHPPAGGGEVARSGGAGATSGAASPVVDVKTMKKKGHFVFFLVLGAVARFGWRRRRREDPLAPWPWLLAGLVLFTGATEVLQFVTWTRTPSVYDWWIDVTGLLTGVALVLFLERIAGADVPCTGGKEP